MKPLGSVQSSSGSLFRRSNGRGLSAAGAVIVVLGALPAWWTISGSGLAPEIGNAFDSPGFVGFFAALAVLAVIIAPEAVGEPLRIDWWPTHLVLVCIATSAFLLAAGGAAVSATETTSRFQRSSASTRHPASGSPWSASASGSPAPHRSSTRGTIAKTAPPAPFTHESCRASPLC